MSKSCKSEAEELKEFVGRQIVVDTSTPILYIGELESIDDYFMTIKNCDVHDVSEGVSTKEVYCIEARKHGVKMNRLRVKVRMALVVSVSLLDDVIEY